MATAVQNHKFINSTLARLVALLIAILIAIFVFVNWADDFGNLFSGKKAQDGSVATSQEIQPVNEALESCLGQRLGDVDAMKEEGILSDAQYAKFRARAEDLCRAQNPG